MNLAKKKSTSFIESPKGISRELVQELPAGLAEPVGSVVLAGPVEPVGPVEPAGPVEPCPVKKKTSDESGNRGKRREKMRKHLLDLLDLLDLRLLDGQEGRPVGRLDLLQLDRAQSR